MALGTDVEPGRVQGHIARAVWAAPLFRGPRVVDVGAGAGYPTVTVGLLRPELTVVLCERSVRKAQFLEYLLARLGVSTMSVEARDFREVAGGGGFGSVCAQALPGLGSLLPEMVGSLAPDGRLVLFLGRSRAVELVPGLEAQGFGCELLAEPGSRERVALLADRLPKE